MEIFMIKMIKYFARTQVFACKMCFLHYELVLRDLAITWSTNETEVLRTQIMCHETQWEILITFDVYEKHVSLEALIVSLSYFSCFCSSDTQKPERVIRSATQTGFYTNRSLCIIVGW